MVLRPALKCDLREEPSVKEKLYRRGLLPVSYEEGLAVARTIRATRYLGKFASMTSLITQNARQSIIGVCRKLYMRQPERG